jgi:hypothetical protein
MSEMERLTGRLVAAARVLAGVGRDDFAKAAGISTERLQTVEAKGSAWINDEDVPGLRAALERYGIILVEESDGLGAGVRLKFTRQDVRQLLRLETEGGPALPDDVP